MAHLVLGICATTSGISVAQEWGGMIGFGTDNIFRGASLSGGRPAWLADLHYRTENRWTAGIGATAERPADEAAAAQLTVYLNRAWRLDDDWGAQIGAVHYESPWNSQRDSFRYNDLNLAVGFRNRWQLSITFSPDTPGAAGRRIRKGFATSVALTAQQPLSERLAVEAGLGVTDLRWAGALRRDYGHLGLRYRVGDIYLYSSVYWIPPGGSAYGDAEHGRRWVSSIVWNF
ncbi:MAG: hypothetical protein ABI411_02020 [Tahibacter sp.]